VHARALARSLTMQDTTTHANKMRMHTAQSAPSTEGGEKRASAHARRSERESWGMHPRARARTHTHEEGREGERERACAREGAGDGVRERERERARARERDG
jgi:hypothetical protein